ncbi:hypothetical protein [Bradyrhizobium sp.]|uniref:hypothetical protein n=1 Tax=Bradyrhizobium sp. TaxID=376 RepID=UPI0040380AF1
MAPRAYWKGSLKPSLVTWSRAILKGGRRGSGTKRRSHSTARRSTAHCRPARKSHRSAARQRRAS